ncbi:unnamed protein product [Dovyalis caffra]|uniref:Myb-like domain-containing protein n=1 Tax=Dovyalis caffra TaxID=77055 RepID=A0AAV1RW91_9ROSI|nr:unnamed protein product [Dovyalis caffra]
MFEGVADQLHQFIASRTTSLPLPSLSFPPLHGSSNTTNFPSFYPYTTTTTSHQVPVLQPNFLHPLHQGAPTNKDIDEKQENTLGAINFDQFERERSVPELVNPWSNDEVLALLRIRSSLENWFPEFTWEHVSRKLGEVGFKRSAEKCKEKFEEESRYFNSNLNYNKNYRASSFSEFEEIYHGDQNPHQEVTAGEKNKKIDKPSTDQDEEQDKIGQNLEDETRIDQTVGNQTDQEDNGKLAQAEKSKSKKRKREKKKKFEMYFKGLCEDVVNKMMAQQEKMHSKLLEDMVKRDEEKVAREEARKKQEMDRINKELELRAHEQALAGDRQATLIKFLKKFTSSDSSVVIDLGERSAPDLVNLPNCSNASSSSSLVLAQNPNPVRQTSNESQLKAPTSSTIALDHQKPTSTPAKTNTSSTENQAPQNPSPTLAPNIPHVPTTSSALALAPQNPNSLNSRNSPSGPPSTLPNYNKVQAKSTSNDKDDIGKRWPRDEVLALINTRCSLYNTNNEDKEGSAKAPLWERISQGMLELGYKRSAKRCKEKWENINKYFRKTKDVSKKRSIDSRTCPYFHQLSTFYSQGTLVAPDNRSTFPENRSNSPETTYSSSSQNGTSNSTMHVAEGEKNVTEFGPVWWYGAVNHVCGTPLDRTTNLRNGLVELHKNDNEVSQLGPGAPFLYSYFGPGTFVISRKSLCIFNIHAKFSLHRSKIYTTVLATTLSPSQQLSGPNHDRRCRFTLLPIRWAERGISRSVGG